MLGRRLEGIWHTAVVVHGKEYFFGGGVQSMRPGTTPAGSPDRVVEQGSTEASGRASYAPLARRGG